MAADRAFVALTGKLEVTGELPAELRGRPLLLATNHIGVFDGFVMVAACHKAGITPSLMSTGGLFDAPIVGWVWRRCGHVRVDRGKRTVTQAMDNAIEALQEGHTLIIYPEGRVSRDPLMWPEKGKTGAARIALGADATVIPVSQWGAHEAVIWGTLVVSGWADFKPLMMSWFRAVRRRPTFRVHFGAPVDLSDLSSKKPGDASRARDRIMRAIATGLVRVRPGELDRMKFHDPTRPTESKSPWTPDQL
ncbi:1-acyl-sn-glycerol-3-phosphate acyltransferase [Crossiella equi]|uniref:1-acyl-sn-glycerol-3-phosphate acyltransferase n=1 Tax=Crossiella equi TaxID=130796 RepID=A0ABS5AKV9_9PSEU|nr:lysophospholipid acyltransferase family protein [Crossiella equi]MBP2477198.1 1-acyl-sn-glycerol-3-phosphate acyltransferase [Crossiella equi]